MSTEPRSAIVNLLVTKNLQVDEPDWCTGHRTDRAEFKTDISHTGPEHAIEIDGFPILVAMLTQHPYAERASAAVGLYIEHGDFTGTYTPDEVEQLANVLVQAAAQLRVHGRALAEILDGGTA